MGLYLKPYEIYLLLSILVPYVLKAMFDEYSAGAILFSLNENSGRIEYLLLRHTLAHWEFPKGNIEFGEDGFETARREIYEETGINDIEFIKDFESNIEYYFNRSDKLVHKLVIFYMARTNTRNIILSSEHDAFAWKEYNEAINQLTYKNARDLLKKAKRVQNAGSTTEP
ncbi:MAG: NUDIX domain-containing protein [Candidatus Nitrosopolaris sp.]